jgi:coenzyme F420-0:L-glutamate ligase/coenzyme F420-1:gamma-L-glutamate ligase
LIPVDGRLEVFAPEGIDEIRHGDDLVQLLGVFTTLRDGDIVLVTSKALAKAEGMVRPGERDAAIAAVIADEVAAGGRIVARRGPTTIVRTRHGLTLAAAGVDNSNVDTGSHVLLPRDPDASARAMRARFASMEDVNVAVVITDTAGRAWREGQTDIAIGAAGLRVVDSHAGRTDEYGNLLSVTAPAVADELAGAAELAQGKTSGRPFAVIRGREDLVLPPGVDGPGALGLIRQPAADMFGLGAREAVLAALAGRDAAAYGAPAGVEELLVALAELDHPAHPLAGSAGVSLTAATPLAEGDLIRLTVLGHAFGWAFDETSATFRPGTP